MRLVVLVFSCWGITSLTNCVDVGEPYPNSFSPPPPLSASKLPPELRGTDVPIPPELDMNKIGEQYFGVHAPLDFESLRSEIEIGDKRGFWVVNQEEKQMEFLLGELRFQSPKVNWYIEEGLEANEEQWLTMVEIFETSILASVLERFGEIELLDAQPITIFYADLDGVGGYFRSADNYSTMLNPFSNEESMIYINASFAPIGTSQLFRTLSHELQHLTHYNIDSSEETWVNEGLSGLAEFLVGYSPRSWDIFMDNPTVSLINWSPTGSHSLGQYGASSLFFTYLFYSTGGFDSLSSFVEIPDDGVHGVDVFLNKLGLQKQFLNLYEEWIVANLVGINDSEFYPPTDKRPLSSNNLELGSEINERMEQFSVSYTEIELSDGPIAVEFNGQSNNLVFPDLESVDTGCWWGNSGDSIHSTLTRKVNLLGLKEPTFKFEVWYEIEENWDYAYVSISEDDGFTWELTPGLHTTNGNPFGISLGPGYSGSSEGWLKEEISLSGYVGSEILLRLNYVTDDALTGNGICVSNLSVSEIDSIIDYPISNNEWYGDGFFWQNNHLSQPFVVWVVEFFGDSEHLIRKVNLNESNYAKINLPKRSQTSNRVVVIVSPVSQLTQLDASYSLKLFQPSLN